MELKFAKHAIHFEKYLTRDSRQFTFFKQYFTKSVGPGRFSAEKLKVISEDGQTDKLIWGGLGNLQFLQVNYYTNVAHALDIV